MNFAVLNSELAPNLALGFLPCLQEDRVPDMLYS